MVEFIAMDFAGVEDPYNPGLDYPTAWAIQREVGDKLAHHAKCSSRPEWRMLCDCGAIRAEWERRNANTGLALSIQQPWAWLIVNGYKPVENRTWPTKVRGWIGIHAGKKIDAEGYQLVRENFPQIELPTSFEVGGIVGRARITGCVEDHDSPWFFGPYGFTMEGAEPLPFRECRGRLGFFRPGFTTSTPEATDE